MIFPKNLVTEMSVAIVAALIVLFEIWAAANLLPPFM